MKQSAEEKKRIALQIGENIKAYRIKAGFTQKQLAEKCNFHVGTIQQYELGKRTANLEKLIVVAQALDIRTFSLLEGIKSDYDGVSREEIEYIIEKNKLIDEGYNEEMERIKSSINSLNVAGLEKLADYSELLVSSGLYKRKK